VGFTGRQILTQPADGVHLDAFGRARVSNNHILMASAQLDHAQPALWDTKVETGGTIGAHSSDRASTTISIDTTANARAVRQTRPSYAYKPGQSQLIAITFVGRVGDSLRMVRRSSASGSPVDVAVDQAAWNIDPMDGAGPSGIDLDPSKAQILLIDLQWLGVGRVRTAFDIGGVIVPVHAFNHANIIDSVYMSEARLPIRYEVVNDGSANTYLRAGYFDDANGIYFEIQLDGLVAVDLETICASVAREGGGEDQAMPNSVATPITAKTQMADDELRSIVAIRLKATNPRAVLRDLAAELVNEDASTAEWKVLLVRGGDLPAGFTTWVDAGNAAFPSPVEYSVDAVDMLAASANARAVLSGFLPSGGGSDETSAAQRASLPYVLSSDIDGASDVLVLCAQSSSGNIDVWGRLAWGEDL
jgi:hypothetical protein